MWTGNFMMVAGDVGIATLLWVWFQLRVRVFLQIIRSESRICTVRADFLVIFTISLPVFSKIPAKFAGLGRNFRRTSPASHGQTQHHRLATCFIPGRVAARF
jgi:hypothetical protein